MKSLRAWIPLISLICLSGALGFALIYGGDPAAVASPLTGKPAPALDVPMLSGGGDLTGDALRGKPHLLNFFASWCGPCAAENGLLMKISADHRIEIVGVAMKDNAEPLKAYLMKRGNPYTTIALDENGRTAIDWGVVGVPETFAIDANGNVVDRHIGELTDDDAIRLINSAQVTPQ